MDDIECKQCDFVCDNHYNMFQHTYSHHKNKKGKHDIIKSGDHTFVIEKDVNKDLMPIVIKDTFKKLGKR